MTPSNKNMVLQSKYKPRIDNWRQFTRIVRSKGCRLLRKLDEFPGAILVTGCQRSGTTILSRIITQSNGMENYWTGSDDELDAALILSGYLENHPSGRRYCFQTTYLDECYREYYEHKGQFKIIWLIRNPYSVIYSLKYNWAPGALEGTFNKTATHLLSGFEKTILQLLGSWWISQTRQACLLYKAKTLQLLELLEVLGRERVFVVDYDDMVLQKDVIFQQIYQFVDLEYTLDYTKQLHHKSIEKKNKLSKWENRTIGKIAEPYYKLALGLKSTQTGNK